MEVFVVIAIVVPEHIPYLLIFSTDINASTYLWMTITQLQEVKKNDNEKCDFKKNEKCDFRRGASKTLRDFCYMPPPSSLQCYALDQGKLHGRSDF